MPSAASSPLLNRLWTALLDLLYPRRCEACEAPLAAGRTDAARWLCDACVKALPRLKPPYCSVCGEPYDGAITDTFRCGNCQNLRLHFEGAVAGYLADGAVRELIHRFKYQRQLHLRGLLGCLLAHALSDPRVAAEDSGSWILVPVPLYHARKREREYNQSWELCTRLKKLTGLRAMDAMLRVRPTTPQASLSRRQRLQNLRGAFRMKRRFLRQKVLEGRKVLLVDDVLTTGSTTSECARVLRREAGVARVMVLTVARG